MNRRTFLNLCKYVVAIALLVFVIWSNWAPSSGHGLKETWQKHFVEGQPIHYHFLLLAFFIALVSTVLTFIRWYFLVRAVNLPFTVGNAVRLGAVGFFFNSFLPGSVGGDIIKAAFLAREQSRRTVAVATVVMDRVIALWALVWFVGLLGLAFWVGGMLPNNPNQPSQVIVAASLIIMVVSWAVWMLLGLLPDARAEHFAGRLTHLPKVGPAAAEFWRAVWMYRQKQWAVYLVMAMCWISHVGFVLTYYFCVLTLCDDTSQIPQLTEHFLLVPIGLVIQAIPLVPGGYGLGELGFGKLYLWFGCSADNGVLGSLVQRVVSWALGLLSWIVYLWTKPALQPAVTEIGPPAIEPTAQAMAG